MVFVSWQKKRGTTVNKYYHLTTKENAEQILKEGLLPKRKERRNLICDEREGIFLCGKDDIPYWQIILNLPIILEVSNIEIDKENIYYYGGGYKEYIYTEKIDSRNIRHINMKVNKDEAMSKLVYEYIMSLSWFTILCARYYYYDMSDKELYEDINSNADGLLTVLPNIDFSVCSKEDIIEFLKSEGESGGYTICDSYLMTGHRLYEQLIYYPDDGLSEKRRKIYEYIKTNLNGCLNVNTGGWCV